LVGPTDLANALYRRRPIQQRQNNEQFEWIHTLLRLQNPETDEHDEDSNLF